jgi:hypothetical protein
VQLAFRPFLHFVAGDDRADVDLQFIQTIKEFTEMSLTQHLSEYIRACFTGLWIESHEHSEALTEIAQLCSEQEWRLATWNIESGLQIPGTEINESSSDPLAAVRSVNALAESGGTAILILENFHRFLQSRGVKILSRHSYKVKNGIPSTAPVHI